MTTQRDKARWAHIAHAVLLIATLACLMGGLCWLPFSIPVFAVLLILYFVSAIWLHHADRRLNELNDTTPLRCPQCDYNIVGTLAAHRTTCPECGTPLKEHVQND